MLTPSITNDFSFVVTLELNTSSLVSAFFPPSRSPAPGATTRWCTTSVETAGAGFPFGRCPFHLPRHQHLFQARRTIPRKRDELIPRKHTHFTLPPSKSTTAPTNQPTNESTSNRRASGDWGIPMPDTSQPMPVEPVPCFGQCKACWIWGGASFATATT